MKEIVAVPMNPKETDNALAQYSATRTAIGRLYNDAPALLRATTSIRQGQNYQKQAEAWRQIAKIARDETAERQAAEIRIQCEHRIGELPKELEQTGQRAGKGHTKQKNRMSSAYDIRPTLQELGIGRTQSSKWQRMAEHIPLPQLQQIFEQARVEEESPQVAVNRALGWRVKFRKQAVIAMEKGEGRGPFAVIYADPPWPYEPRPDGITLPYKTLSFEKIESFLEDRKIDVREGAVLYLWATIPYLLQALAVMEKWGFEYKHSVAWDKQSALPSRYFQSRWEVLLLGYKGKFPTPVTSNEPNLLSIKSGAHSVKPDQFSAMIERQYPSFGWQNRIELFARRTRAGWLSLVEGAFKNHPSEVDAGILHLLIGRGWPLRKPTRAISPATRSAMVDAASVLGRIDRSNLPE